MAVKWGTSVKIKVAILALSVVWASQATASSFDALYVFGDSTVDSGWWKGALNGQCGPVSGSCTTGSAGKDGLISNAIAHGGTGAPVGVGLMNTQILATDLGISNFLPANQPGGTNYAISGALTAISSYPGGNTTGNLNVNPNLPSTVQQMSNYLGPVLNTADPNALYLISSGGNDITYAKDQASWNLSQKESYLTTQAAALAAEIATLQTDGAKHIVVYGNGGNGTLGTFWTGQLFTDLTSLSVNFIGADIAGMVAEVQANPTAYGFTAATVVPGTVGGTNSACATQTGAGATTSGWGQWCANTTTASTLYASLTSANAEQTSFYSDNQHFSAAGQLIEADYVFGLIQASEAPLPATLPLFASGLGALGLLGWRRKKTAATISA